MWKFAVFDGDLLLFDTREGDALIQEWYSEKISHLSTVKKYRFKLFAYSKACRLFFYIKNGRFSHGYYSKIRAKILLELCALWMALVRPTNDRTVN